jgi:NADPH:quinone reductase-like Zn-dependent oxidoreductase
LSIITKLKKLGGILVKAIVYTKYGSPDVLQLKEVEKPTPRDNEVLIKVHAASVNDWDWGNLRGKPFVNRLFFGLRKPKYKILGSDIAGRVEAVGANAKQFQPGDEVFGDLCECGWGGFAEYVCARENALVLKPASMTFEEAAAVPQAALLALQGLRDKRQIQPGQKVLINGAGGGAGTFAVQIAKSFGAEVTGVDSTMKLDMMRSIGADQVIDYTQEDFTKNGQRYDLIIDNAAHHSIFDYKRALSPKGIYVMLGGSSARIFQVIFLGPLISMTGNKKMGILGLKPNKDLAFMKELFEAGKVVPVIDRRYPLSEVAEALRYFGEGHAQGKIVITM